MSKSLAVIPVERVASRIYLMRNRKVMLDRDLAKLYGVKAIALRQQVKRNIGRFPEDFMFQVSKEEAESLVSQSVIPSMRSLGGTLPYAFTQEGVAMLSGVLRSRQAIRVNVAIMRAFVKLREIFATHEDLARRVARHDQEIGVLFQQVRTLLTPPENPKRKRIGFLTAGA